MKDTKKSIKMAFYGIATIVFIFACGQSDPKNATRILEAQGYKNVEITGFSPFGCNERDWYKTKFKAEKRSGYEITGVVCTGLIIRNSTIRID